MWANVALRYTLKVPNQQRNWMNTKISVDVDENESEVEIGGCLSKLVFLMEPKSYIFGVSF